jgi:hypothetical protein
MRPITSTGRRRSMKTATAWLAGLVAYTVAGSAIAQEQCPTAQIGQTCDAGVCVQATCTNRDADGSTTAGTCGACVDPGPNPCPLESVGQPCGDAGGLCDVLGAGAGGGATTGAGPSFMISYSLGVCVPPSDAGAGNAVDAAGLAAASSGGGGRGQQDQGADSGGSFMAGDDAATTHAQPATGSTASGCAISHGETGGLEAPALVAAVTVLFRRRKRAGARSA